MISRKHLAFAVLALAAVALPSVAEPELEPGTSLARLRLVRDFGQRGLLPPAAARRLGIDFFTHVRFDAQGRIVVADGRLVRGDIDRGTDAYEPRVARLLANGRPDPDFGARGVTELPMLLIGVPAGFTVDAQDRILVSGRFARPSGGDVGALRIRADGEIDGAFGTGGVVGAANGDAWRFPCVSAADGSITVATETHPSATLMRMTDAGEFDAAFGTGGALDIGLGSVRALALDASGRAVVSRVYEPPSSDLSPPPRAYSVSRFGADGTPDAAFGGDGRLHGPGGREMFATDVSIDALGRIVVLGGEIDGAGGIFRFLGDDGALDRTFSDDGRAVLQSAFPGDAESGSRTLAVASGAADRYVVAAGLTFLTQNLSHPDGTGWYVQTIDGATPGAVASVVTRDPRPIRRAQTLLSNVTVTADGTSAVAVGSTTLRLRGRTTTVPVLARIDLIAPKPAALPNLTIAWTGAPVIDRSNGFRFTAPIEVTNLGTAPVAEASIGFWLSEDDVVDASDWALGAWFTTGPVGRSRTVRLSLPSGGYDASGVNLAGKRLIAVVNPYGTVLESAFSDNSAVSTAVQ